MYKIIVDKKMPTTYEECGSYKIDEDDYSPFIYVNESRAKSWSNIPPGCVHCSNHPSNGGSGICYCVIGTQTIT